MSQIANIGKPEAERFKNKRKIYLVPLLYTSPSAPLEFTIMFDTYWHQAAEHLANLQRAMGPAAHIFHETISKTGDEALELLDKLSPPTAKIVREMSSAAPLEALEDEDILTEAMDWQRHLMVGFINSRVAQTVSDLFDEASRKRFEHMGKVIAETLANAEAGILFIHHDHRIQFASDIEVFTVAPPVMDEIQRWMVEYREKQEAAQQAEEAEHEHGDEHHHGHDHEGHHHS